MKRFLTALGVAMLCLAIFGACGNNGDEVSQEIPQENEQQQNEEPPTPAQDVTAGAVVPMPDFWLVPDDSDAIFVYVDGRNITFSLSDADISDFTITELRDDGNIAASEIVYIEQISLETPFSHEFTLGSDVPAGNYALIVGGEGAGFPIRSNFQIQ